MSGQTPKKKKHRGLGSVIARQLMPLNKDDEFKQKFKNKKAKLLLNATDGKFAALITIDQGTVDVDSIKNSPKENLKKKKAGWNGRLQTKTEVFLNFAMGKISMGKLMGMVFTRKIKLRGPRKLLLLMKIFDIISK